MVNELGSWQDHVFEVLHEDEHLLAVNKPSGLLVHRTGISEDKVFLLQLLRDQLGLHLFPVHRLDRGTSGALVFGKTSEVAGLLGAQFMEKSVTKKYLAIVRGHAPDAGTVDYPLAKEPGAPKREAVTHFRTLGRSEIGAAIGTRYPTARFSLVEASPETGRQHQIRKHLAHILHPVMVCRFGDHYHNRYFRETLGIRRLLLHAARLEFSHPASGQRLSLAAELDEDFRKALEITQLGSFGF